MQPINPGTLSKIQPVDNQELVIAAVHSEHLIVSAPDDALVAEGTPAVEVVAENGDPHHDDDGEVALQAVNVSVTENISGDGDASGLPGNSDVNEGQSHPLVGNVSASKKISGAVDASTDENAPATGCNGACNECCNKVK